MSLTPINDSFLFEFTNEVRDGKFIEKSRSGFILTNQTLDEQVKYARWGRVLAIGKDVQDFKVGDLALIEQGQWTTSVKFEGQSYWKSDESKVIAVSNDENVTFTA